jgi:Ca2+-transporting ATPase
MISVATPPRRQTQQPEPEQTTSWHTLDNGTVLQTLDTSPTAGLTDAEAQKRLDQVGPNELIERGVKSPWLILWEQLTAVMMLVLVAAAGIKLFLGEYVDAVAILAIVVLNAVLGLIQEYRAERAMAALKRMAAPMVRVRRDGRVRDIPARTLVPGDVILLEAGSIVPADARLVESANLRVQEASLTGESLPVDKTPGVLSTVDAPLGDRHNMLYFGTSVTYGRGAAVVVGTGMQTELGRIASLLQEISSEMTPLQRRIRQLGIMLALAALLVVTMVFTVGVLRGREAVEMFLAAVAIAVAAIPEGLPAVLTITLALGAQRMLRRRALIRKLPAVETLGSVTVICSDKTGTLTENRMTVTILDVAGRTADLNETLRSGQPLLSVGEAQQQPDDAQALLLAGAALCNDAVLDRDDNGGAYAAIGDPTEGALIVAAARFGLWKPQLEGRLPRVGELPFSSERKRMTTLHRLLRDEDAPALVQLSRLLDRELSEYVAFTKGSVDGLLDISTHVWEDGKVTPMMPQLRARIEEGNNRLAQQGLRVLGVAYRPLADLSSNGQDEKALERDLIFVGMVGMMDPPRPEVKDAVLTARQAGIRPVMITGDHPLTALQIARDLHIASPDNGSVLTGQELEGMSAEELEGVVETVPVYARVSPEHKLRIVEALQRRGHIVAMTGDGVNDAPALRRSDIGVAMGITGTDVSKEASDMVITDDNFATIVSAVEEGRTIYDNVRKFVKYIVTSNTGEVLVMFLTQLFGMPLPMTTLQILWMNLVTDGVPGLALGLEPTERDAMRRAPFSPKEGIFSRGLGRHVLTIGPVLALVAFGVGYWAWISGNPAWGTMVFVTLTLSQLGHALAVRSNRESLFKIGLRTNPMLLVAVVVTLLLQMMVVYLPPFQAFFETVPLTLADLAICLVASTVVFWAVELEKLWLRRTNQRS